MQIRFALHHLALLATMCASVAGSVIPASADALVPAPQTCTTVNCNALTLPGRINGHPATPAPANSWVGQFAGKPSNCLRFQVTSETRDLAMTVVAPGGAVFTNDNGGVAACTACPRVVIAATTSGFFTATVANKDGAGVDASFTLRVGLYNAGNSPNCASPTPAK